MSRKIKDTPVLTGKDALRFDILELTNNIKAELGREIDYDLIRGMNNMLTNLERIYYKKWWQLWIRL